MKALHRLYMTRNSCFLLFSSTFEQKKQPDKQSDIQNHLKIQRLNFYLPARCVCRVKRRLPETMGGLLFGAVRRTSGHQECAGTGPSIKYHLPWRSDKQPRVIINHEHYPNGIVSMLPPCCVKWSYCIIFYSREKKKHIMFNGLCCHIKARNFFRIQYFCKFAHLFQSGAPIRCLYVH